MDRPASRGLLAGGVQKAPTGLSVEKPERPSTASRQQQQQGGPPSTAQSGRSIGTASGRGGALNPPSTAFRRVLQAGPGALASQPAAQARPMTSQQGMGGLKPSTAAAGRQVLDRTYFVNELRQKRQQIMAVVQQMQVRTAADVNASAMAAATECVISSVASCCAFIQPAGILCRCPQLMPLQEDLEVLDQKKAAAARAEKMAGQLKKEVRLLQEALADNNIIIDKVRRLLAGACTCWEQQRC